MLSEGSLDVVLTILLFLIGAVIGTLVILVVVTTVVIATCRWNIRAYSMKPKVQDKVTVLTFSTAKLQLCHKCWGYLVCNAHM